ncbi:hypothetical protein T484DRAFT_1859648 [Baffinella frigidus]|nr:hypothetical protein T484DRAFT_1859648 [Cryptophyta sp. CCMP2293]
MRLVVAREPPVNSQAVDPQAASSPISFRAHGTRGEEIAARSLPDREPVFSSPAASRSNAVRLSYEVAAAGSGGERERAPFGREKWWQEERGAAAKNAECGAARCPSRSPVDEDNENRSGDHWKEEGERVNSEDECEAGGPSNPARRRELTEQELFELLHRTKGFKVRNMDKDGNCLFRAISDQIYGDPGMHEEVREKCMNYLLAERDHFSNFDFDRYVARKRVNGVFGNNLEMQAMAELYNRPIEVTLAAPSLKAYL